MFAAEKGEKFIFVFKQLHCFLINRFGHRFRRRFLCDFAGKKDTLQIRLGTRFNVIEFHVFGRVQEKRRTLVGSLAPG